MPATYPYWVLRFLDGSYLIDVYLEYAAQEAPPLGPPPGSPTWAPTPWRESATRYYTRDEANDARIDWEYEIDAEQRKPSLIIVKVNRK